LPEAVTHYQAALRLKPDHAGAHYNLGKAYESAADEGAKAHYELAIHAKPDYADAHNNLGVALAAKANSRSELHSGKPCGSNPISPKLTITGKHPDGPGATRSAVVEFRAALRLKPDYLNATTTWGWPWPKWGNRRGPGPIRSSFATQSDDVNVLCSKAGFSRRGRSQFRNGRRRSGWRPEPQLSRRSGCRALDVLAAAYAEAGRFAEATNAARRAEFCATSGGQPELAARIRERLQLYQAGRCYREP